MIPTTAKPREIPILFNDEMVRAILEGRKTQTRRPVRRQPFKDEDGHWSVAHARGIGHTRIRIDEVDAKTNQKLSETWEGPERVIRATQKCPFGRVGDLLWVRECFCHRANDEGCVTGEEGFWYRATDSHLGITKCDEDGGIAVNQDGSESSPWIPSIHMPRNASRLTLRVLRVWLERLQSLSEMDARAEGVPRNWIGSGPGWNAEEHGFLDLEGSKATKEGREILEYGHFTAREAFPSRWDAIYAKGGRGWDSNPWVECCEFEVIQ